MALSSVASFNPLSLPAGQQIGRKNSNAKAFSGRLEMQTCPSLSCNIQLGGVVGRQLAWTSGLWKGRHRRPSSSRGIRRLTVSAVENDESEGGGQADMDALESRLGLGRRARRQQQTGSDGTESKSGASAGSSSSSKAKTKTWENMSFVEKAWSVYIDPEKGVLFWLNKLAYGAIFVIIGAWITFRFIGPALGWYQLDEPLLPPDRLFNSGP